MRGLRTAFLLVALAASSTQAELAPRSQPVYGSTVQLEMQSNLGPLYLPATRYRLSGSTLVGDFEYSNAFGPWGPAFGSVTLTLGELVPGTYTSQARMLSIENPSAPPTIQNSTFEVPAPENVGLYTVPSEPLFNGTTYALIVGPFYFDASTVEVSMSAYEINITYMESSVLVQPGQPTYGPLKSWAAVRLPPLTPGNYLMRVSATMAGGGWTMFTPRSFTVSGGVKVTEFYAESLDHFFLTAEETEIAALDSGASPGWKRTGQTFRAWLYQKDAPPQALPVCRFYAKGPNSHFYTASAGECAWLRDLEAQGVAQAGDGFLGWRFEYIAFWAIAPTGGQYGTCPSDTDPVYRSYNNRAAQMDSNHRFVADARMQQAMTWTWNDEGIAFCSPR